MLEAFIAVVLLIGVLSFGGMPEKTAARSSDASSSAIAPTDEQGGVPCSDKGSHMRDLTVPYASRSTHPPTLSENYGD